jgi:dihydrofolate reductase
MGMITSFTHVSVDGYFAGPNGEIDWLKPGDEADREFSEKASAGPGTLVFGRTTYEMMRSYWPTPEAIGGHPVTAGRMNKGPKVVFSKTMKPVDDGPVWKNVRVLRQIAPEEILAFSEESGGMVILGSGTIVRQFANLGLIDEFQLMVNPIVLGEGKYLFRDVHRMNLHLIESRVLTNGKVFLRYRPL